MNLQCLHLTARNAKVFTVNKTKYKNKHQIFIYNSVAMTTILSLVILP